MINPFSEINWKPGSIELQKFGRTVLIGLLIIAALFLLVNILKLKLPFSKAMVVPLIIAVTGAAVFLLSYCLKPIALPVYYIWFIIGASIGIVVSNILMTLFYYLLFTPLALTLKLLSRRDPLNLKKNSRLNSYWSQHEKSKDQLRYFKQY
jgi:hypothetical protein